MSLPSITSYPFHPSPTTARLVSLRTVNSVVDISRSPEERATHGTVAITLCIPRAVTNSRADDAGDADPTEGTVRCWIAPGRESRIGGVVTVDVARRYGEVGRCVREGMFDSMGLLYL